MTDFYSDEFEAERIRYREQKRREEQEQQEREEQQKQRMQDEALTFAMTPLLAPDYEKKEKRFFAFKEEYENETDVSLFNDAERVNATNNLLLQNDYTFDEIESLPLGVRYRIAQSYHKDTAFLPTAQETAQGVSEMWHNVHNYFSGTEAGFDLGQEIKKDGFSEQDKEEFFSGINNRYDYEFTKRSLQRERALKEFYNHLDEDSKSRLFWQELGIGVLTGGIELMAGGAGLKALTAMAPAKAQEVVATCSRLLKGIPTKTLRMGAEGALFGLGQVALDKAVKYEYTPEEAMMTFGMCAVCGLAFGALRDAPNVIKDACKKLFGDKVKTPNEAVAEAQKAMAKNKEKGKANKFVSFVEKQITADLPVTRSATRVLDYSRDLSETAGKLSDIATDTGGASFRNAENWSQMENGALDSFYVKGITNLHKHQNEIQKVTGTDLLHTLDDIYYNGDISLEIPYASEMNSFVRQLKDKHIRLRQLFEEEGKPLPFLRNDFVTPAGLEPKLSFEDLLALEKKGKLTTNMEYVPRSYDKQAIEENAPLIKAQLEAGAKAHFLHETLAKEKEIAKARIAEGKGKLTKQEIKDIQDKVISNTKQQYEAFEKYKATAIAEQQYKDLTEHHLYDGASIRSREDERTIRIVDEVLRPTMNISAVESMYILNKRMIGELAWIKTLNRVGSESTEQLIQKIKDEIRNTVELAGGKYTDEKIAKKVNLVERSVNVLQAQVEGRLTGTPRSMSNLFGAVSWLCGEMLGATVLNSLGDFSIAVQKYGLNNVIHAFSKKLPAITEKALEGISKEKIAPILDMLTEVFDEGNKGFLLRAFPELLQGNYSASRRYSNKFQQAGQSFAEWVYRVSGLRALEEHNRAMMAALALGELRKKPHLAGVTSKELERMIATENFSDSVRMYMIHETRTLLNRAKYGDIPMMIKEHPALKIFYTFQQWSMSFTNNFVFPFLKGEYGHKHTAETLMYLFCSSAIMEYLRQVRKGTYDDLTTDEGQKNFLQKVCFRSMDELTGIFYIGAGLLETACKSGRPIGAMLEKQSPLLSFASQFTADVIRGLSDIAVLMTTGNAPDRFEKDMKHLLNDITPNLWQKDIIVNNIWRTD